jgi:hypothetical protein
MCCKQDRNQDVQSGYPGNSTSFIVDLVNYVLRCHACLIDGICNYSATIPLWVSVAKSLYIGTFPELRAHLASDF